MIDKDPKRTGLKAVPVIFGKDEDGFLELGEAEPGQFEITGGSVLLACPGCGHVGCMRVGNPKPGASPSWAMTGDPAAPTFSPSINCVGCCGWHGFLKNGVFESC